MSEKEHKNDGTIKDGRRRNTKRRAKILVVELVDLLQRLLVDGGVGHVRAMAMVVGLIPGSSIHTISTQRSHRSQSTRESSPPAGKRVRLWPPSSTPSA
eukprot:3684519-Rhodomonas_salina.1